MSVATKEIIDTIIQIIIVPLLTIFSTFLIKYINIKITAIKKDNKGKDTEVFNKYLDQVNSIIIDTVRATNQIYVDTLKKQGIFDEEAQKKAKEMTKSAVIDILGKEVMTALNHGISDLNAWLDTKIESAVRNEKASL